MTEKLASIEQANLQMFFRSSKLILRLSNKMRRMEAGTLVPYCERFIVAAEILVKAVDSISRLLKPSTPTISTDMSSAPSSSGLPASAKLKQCIEYIKVQTGKLQQNIAAAKNEAPMRG